MTTLFAPITAPSPTVTPFMIWEPLPIHACRQILTERMSCGSSGAFWARRSASRRWPSLSEMRQLKETLASSSMTISRFTAKSTPQPICARSLMISFG